MSWILSLVTGRGLPWLVAGALAVAGFVAYQWEHSTVLKRDATIAQMKTDAAELAERQVIQAAKDKANASQGRAQIEQRNRSLDYPALVDKLRQ